MGQLLLIVVVAVTVAAVVFGVTVLVSGRDPGLSPAEPDGRALPLPTTRPLLESDLGEVRFDLATRGYRMAQVDQALRRAAYDIGYKDELIGVLEAEVTALREGRVLDAHALRRAREAAQAPAAPAPAPAEPGKPGWTEFTRPADSDEIAAPAATPGPAETTATGPASAEPMAAVPASAEPLAAVPAPDEPAPAASEPAAAAPAATEPAAAEPAATEPAAAAPEEVTAGPATTESAFSEPAGPVAGEPAETREQTLKTTPARAGRVAQPEPAPMEPAADTDKPASDAGEPTEPAAPPAKRATRRAPATRASRPAKRATAAVAEPTEAGSPVVSPEEAPGTKSVIGPETSEAATPAEDAESARR